VVAKGSRPVSPESREHLQEGTFVQHEKNSGQGFCVAVSLLDGMVRQTTASLTNILGYPKDMWVGRSFINFVHPVDRETFIKQVTENIGLILRENSTPKSKKETISKSGSFFCRIRIYNGLKSGYSIKERKTRYSPFKLSVCFTEMDSNSMNSSSMSPDWAPEVGPGSSFLILTAIPLMSAFYESREDMTLRPGNHTFITKHNSTCIFSFIDDSAIPYIGYLPQEIFGESIFDFFHCMDLSLLKDMFEVAMLEQGKPCRTKGIRFKVRNGGYVEVNSLWSCFINPWSRQLEFVHGKHTVVMGPIHSDVFAVLPIMDTAPVLKQNLTSQEEIRNILKKTVMKNNFLDVQTSSSKTKKQLSSFMGTLLEEVARNETIKLNQSAKKIGHVVIEKVSPHQSDSSETPPSYNQLTYNENLTRFFNSQPKTLSNPEREEKDKSDSGVSQSQGKSSEDSQDTKEKDKAGKKQNAALRKHIEDGGRSGRDSGEQAATGSGSGNGNSYTLQTGLSAGQVQSGQDECMMSVDESGSGLGSGSRGTSTDAYNPPVLTIELLANHNMDMERKMLCSYKQAKRSGDIRFLKEHRIDLSEARKRQPVQQLGLSAKNKERSITPSKSLQPIPVFSPSNPSNPMWRSYVENESTINNTSSPKHGHEGFLGFNQANMMQRGAPTSFPAFSNIIGVSNMYVPFKPDNGQAVRYDQDHMAKRVQIQNMQARYGSPSLGLSGQVQGIAGIMGVGLASGSSQVVVPTSPGSLAAVSRGIVSPAGMPGRNNVKYSQSASRETSVKGERGSAIGSIATTSVRDKDLHSPAAGDVDTPGDICNAEQAAKVNQGESGGDAYQSTHSSSLYSFLNTSEEDGSVANSSAAEEPKQAKHIARPVLAEPFWNEKVVMTPELELLYQLETRDPKDLLQADLDLLEAMVQHADVEEQILELFSDEEERMDLKQLLTETEQWLLETSSLSSVDENSTDDFGTAFNDAVIRNKLAKKRAYLENLNIFMGAEAPFPMPHSPRLTNKIGWKAFNFSDCSSSEESEHDVSTGK